VLRGTDYPYDMGVEDPVAFVKDLAIPEAYKANIQGGNIARLLAL
jgi:aminocarboxymuconate-semialdehyde decarboxylase